jgi:hypothetical protein
VATSDEIIQGLQQAEAGIKQGISSANAAKGKAEQAIQQSAALGAQDKVTQFKGVKTAIEQAITSMAASQEKVVQALNKAQAAAG